MPIEWGDALVEVIEKAALLRQEIERHAQQDMYAARVNRLASKIDVLRAQLAESDAPLAAAIQMAWERPTRSLAFRNAKHRRESGTGGGA